jgi:hypothetical protein
MLGERLQQPGELRKRFGRGQLVKIIDDQEGAVAMLGELRTNSVRDGPEDCRMALRTASQNCWVSCWSRRTWTTASRYG